MWWSYAQRTECCRTSSLTQGWKLSAVMHLAPHFVSIVVFFPYLPLGSCCFGIAQNAFRMEWLSLLQASEKDEIFATLKSVISCFIF